MPRTVSVTVEFPVGTLELIDQACRARLLTRSSFIRGAVLKELQGMFPREILDRVLDSPNISSLLQQAQPSKTLKRAEEH